MVFGRGEKLKSGQGTDLKRPNQPGAPGYRAKREESWGISAARLERDGRYAKQEVGWTWPEVSQESGIFYKRRKHGKLGTEEKEMRRGQRFWESAGGLGKPLPIMLPIFTEHLFSDRPERERGREWVGAGWIHGGKRKGQRGGQFYWKDRQK